MYDSLHILCAEEKQAFQLSFPVSCHALTIGSHDFICSRTLNIRGIVVAIELPGIKEWFRN
jgi:hypothetical protein